MPSHTKFALPQSTVNLWKRKDFFHYCCPNRDLSFSRMTANTYNVLARCLRFLLFARLNYNHTDSYVPTGFSVVPSVWDTFLLLKFQRLIWNVFWKYRETKTLTIAPIYDWIEVSTLTYSLQWRIRIRLAAFFHVFVTVSLYDRCEVVSRQFLWKISGVKKLV